MALSAQVLAYRTMHQQLAANARAEIEAEMTPSTNPFVRKYDKSNKKDNAVAILDEDEYEARIERAKKEEAAILADVEDDTVRYAVEILTHAGLMGWHGDDEQRKICGVIVARNHYISDRSVTRIMKDLAGVNTANQADYHRHISGYSTQAQCQTLSFFTKRMKEVVLLSPGGIEAWEAGSRDARAAVLMRLFDEIPFAVCRNAFPFEFNVVDFELLFCAPLPENDAERQVRIKWRFAYKQKFVNLALATYKYRTKPVLLEEMPDHQSLFNYWKTFMHSGTMARLNLGKTTDVPIKNNRGYAGRRSIVNLVVDAEPEDFEATYGEMEL